MRHVNPRDGRLFSPHVPTNQRAMPLQPHNHRVSILCNPSPPLPPPPPALPFFAPPQLTLFADVLPSAGVSDRLAQLAIVGRHQGGRPRPTLRVRPPEEHPAEDGHVRNPPVLRSPKRRRGGVAPGVNAVSAPSVAPVVRVAPLEARPPAGAGVFFAVVLGAGQRLPALVRIVGAAVRGRRNEYGSARGQGCRRHPGDQEASKKKDEHVVRVGRTGGWGPLPSASGRQVPGSPPPPAPRGTIPDVIGGGGQGRPLHGAAFFFSLAWFALPAAVSMPSTNHERKEVFSHKHSGKTDILLTVNSKERMALGCVMGRMRE